MASSGSRGGLVEKVTEIVVFNAESNYGSTCEICSEWGIYAVQKADVRGAEERLQKQIQEAISMMNIARAWLGKKYIAENPAIAESLLGKMEIRLVMHIHGKKVKGTFQHASLNAIGRHFVQEVKEIKGNIRNSPRPDTAAKFVESAQLRNVLEVGPDGSIDHKLLKEMYGFELGSTVMLKKQKRGTPSLVYHITTIDKTIELVAHNDSKRVVSSGQLVDLFRLVEVRYDIVARSADFRKLEEHPDAKQDSIRFTARGVLGAIFRLHQLCM